MKEFLFIIVELVNDIHDKLIRILDILGIEKTDKELHFWVIGIIGIFLFLFTHFIFHWISKFSITAISFIYTFTVLCFLVFAIEIQQKLTNRGNMEFYDAVVGLWGFVSFFLVYLMIYMFVLFIKKNIEKRRRMKRNIDEKL